MEIYTLIFSTNTRRNLQIRSVRRLVVRIVISKISGGRGRSVEAWEGYGAALQGARSLSAALVQHDNSDLLYKKQIVLGAFQISFRAFPLVITGSRGTS